MIEQLIPVSLFLFGISIVFIPLEFSFKQNESNVFRKEWFTDLFFYLGQAFVWNTFTVYILNLIFNSIEFDSLKGIRNLFLAQNFFVQIIEVIFFSDLLIYWGHRFQHKYDILWRFHRVHHTAETVDYIAAFREHPLDNIYTRGLETLPAVVLGFDLNQIAGYITFRGLWALFIHSNVNIRLGVIEIIFGSPHLHHWHHELELQGKCNYANLSPLMDLLFGSYYNPKNIPKKFGISEKINHSYFRQILDPLIPKKFLK